LLGANTARAMPEVSVSRSEALTDGLRVEVEARFAPEHSNPGGNQWFFLYRIRISNEGGETCRLVSRHWIIRNATGKDTPFGSMEGTYQMETEGGAHFEAEIARFDLREPHAIH
jgi:ApaG protein